MAAATGFCHPASTVREIHVSGENEMTGLNSASFEVPQTWSGLSSQKTLRRTCSRDQSGLFTQGASRRVDRSRRNAVVMSIATVDAAENVPPELLTAEGRRKFQEDRFPSQFQILEIETAGQPEWNPAQIVSSVDVAPGVRCITINAEVGREMIPIERAYRTPGQQVVIKVGDGPEERAVPSTSPPSPLTNRAVLEKLRGDIPAGTTKMPQYTVSVRANMDLHVLESESPALYNAAPGVEVQVGAFEKGGLDLRPILFLARFPTILIFASGKGIAPARAILEASTSQMGSLQLDLRDSVRLFYSAPNPSALAYKDKFASWETYTVKVRPTVSSIQSGETWNGFIGTFSQLFDEDDLTYDETTTGVVILGDKDTVEDVQKLANDAGIPEKHVIHLEL